MKVYIVNKVRGCVVKINGKKCTEFTLKAFQFSLCYTYISCRYVMADGIKPY